MKDAKGVVSEADAHLLLAVVLWCTQCCVVIFNDNVLGSEKKISLEIAEMRFFFSVNLCHPSFCSLLSVDEF